MRIKRTSRPVCRPSHFAAASLVCLLLLGPATRNPIAQQAAPDRPQGLVFVTSANIVSKGTGVSAETFLPSSTKTFRCIISIGDQGDAAGTLMYFDLARRLGQATDCAVMYLRPRNMTGPQPGRTPEQESVRNAELGGAEGLFAMLAQLAKDSGHPELTKVPLLFWGFSGSAAFGVSFASLYPERTLAFVRYHVHLRGVPRDRTKLTQVPALIIAGGKDQTSGVEDAEEMFRTGRMTGASWTFAVEPEATHAAPEIHPVTAGELTIPWMTAVIRQRLTTSVPAPVAWLGDPVTRQIAPENTFAGDKARAVWLPDETVALGWQRVMQGGK